MKWMQSLHRVLLITVLFATVAPIVVHKKAAAQGSKIEWITDLRQAREVAERQNRLVLLHFWSETCPPCKQLERGVFNRPEFIRALTTGYVPVKINVNEQEQLADFYNIETIPTDVVVTPTGREVKRFQSLQDPNQYIAVLDGIRAHAGAGHYEPASSDSTPVAAKAHDAGSMTNRYGGTPATQSAPTQYGQSTVALSQDSPENSPLNRYSTPFNQPTTPQQQQIAPRYSNPYGDQPPTNSNETGSRWSQPIAGNEAANTSGTQQPATPQTNSFANPAPESRQVTPGLAVQNKPVQNPLAGNTVSQQSYAQSPQTPQARIQPQAAPSETEFSLEGYCPVTLVNSRAWVRGDRRWGANHEGRIYLFAGPAQQQQFLANPQVYAPLMAGYDPVRFAETGQLVAGQREFGLYISEPGPIALFADEAALERFHANAGYYVNAVQQARLQPAGRATR
jgi:thioredoxin-related protein